MRKFAIPSVFFAVCLFSLNLFSEVSDDRLRAEAAALNGEKQTRQANIAQLQARIPSFTTDFQLAQNQAMIDVEQAAVDEIDKEINKNEAARLDSSPSPCAPEEKKAVSACSFGLDPIQEAMLRQTMNQASAMMQQGGSEKTCKAAKMVQTVAMGANFAHAAMCAGAIKACKSTCPGKISAASAKGPAGEIDKRLAEKSLAKCGEMESRAIASIGAGMGNLMGMASSAKCQKAVTTAAPPPGSSPPPQAYDCTNPMMASQPNCICAANPADPVCTASNGGLGDGGFSSVGEGSGAVDGGKDPEMFGFEDEIGREQASGGAGAAAQGSSGGGGGMNGGGGAGALPPEEMGGAGSGPYNTDIMGGLTGGGGGGSSFGRGGSGEGSGGGLLDSLAEKFNLKGFLPSKGDFKNRGLASGMADGITGPNGPSLFEKVSSRYLKKQSELLP